MYQPRRKHHQLQALLALLTALSLLIAPLAPLAAPTFRASAAPFATIATKPLADPFAQSTYGRGGDTLSDGFTHARLSLGHELRTLYNDVFAAESVAAQTNTTFIPNNASAVTDVQSSSSFSTASLTPPPTPTGGEVFVKQTATGSGNGSSWDNALGEANLRAALIAGGTIYIAEGTYIVNTGGVFNAASISNGTSVIGGFPNSATGTDVSGYDPEQHPTIFNGDGKRVLDLGSGTIVIQGLQINNSDGGGTGGSAIRAAAGGQPYNWSILDSVFKNTTGVGASNAVWILPGGFQASSRLRISNSTFDNNVITGGAHGAALRLEGVSNNLFTNDGAQFVIENISFSNNRSTGGSPGGAVEILTSRGVNFYDVGFCGNHTDNYGGALHASDGDKLVFERCSVTGNNNGAEYGGAFRFTGSDTITINQCTFVNNNATTSAIGAGGAIAVESGSPYTITNSSFYNNSANQRGGAITFQGGGDITIDNSTFKDNTTLAAVAVTGGGGVYIVSGAGRNIRVNNSVFDSNRVTDHPSTTPGSSGGGAITVGGGASPSTNNNTYYNNSYNAHTTILKDDIFVYGGGVFTAQNSDLQPAQASFNASYNVSTGNTFNNTTDPGLSPAPIISCPTGLPSSVAAAPDLAISIGQPSPNLVAGVASNIPVTVTNQGTGPATGSINTTITLPAGVTAPASFSGGNGWSCTTAGSTVTCVNAGPINNGASSTFNVPVTPGAGTVGTTPGPFSASVTAVSGETNSSNNGPVNMTPTTPVAAAPSDTDGDGVNDSVDLDDDNDGILDSAEGNGSVDTDGDSIPDSRDLDTDNDGILDVIEAGHAGADANGDGEVDGAVGANGLPDAVETAVDSGAPNYTLRNTDGDAVADWRDLDSDNDGLNDVIENNGTDANNDGRAAGTDADGDGISASADGSPSWGDTGNPAPPNTDGDALPDYRDLDSDNDGLNDVREANGTDADGNGQADGTDTDGDGIPATADGSATWGDAASPTLPNTDGDAVPDYRDLDSDNDGINDVLENGGTDADGNGQADGTDADNDGIPATADGSPAWGDTNDPTLRNTDGDAVPDFRDLDTDNDGINDVRENGGTDADGNGQADGTDADGDGIPATADGSVTWGDTGNVAPPNSDNDLIPDYRDIDSDNDTISDLVEGGQPGAVDANNDGVADGPDADGDGIMDSVDGVDNAFGDSGDPLPTNTDGDAKPNYSDPDSDDPTDTTGNGTDDDIDGTPNSALDGNGDGKVDNPADADNDGVADVVDTNTAVFGGLGAAASTGSFLVAKWLNTPQPVKVGQLISFTIRITNTGASPINALPLTDTYDLNYIGYSSVLGSTPATNDNADDGQLNWSDVTGASSLAPNAVLNLTTWFIAKADTSALPATAPCNRAGHTCNVVRANSATLVVAADATAAQDIVVAFAPVQIVAEQKSTLGDWVWYDVNQNGVKDDGNTGLNGVRLNLYVDGLHGNPVDGVPQAGEFVTTTTTATDVADLGDDTNNTPGYYDFRVNDNLTFIVEVDPSNFTVGGPLNGMTYTGNNAVNPYNGDSPRVVILANSGPYDYNHADFPFWRPAGLVKVGKQLNTPDPVRVGDAISFTIRITNTGSVTVTSLPLTDTFNAALLTFVSSTPAPTSVASGVLSWSNLAPVGGVAPNGAVTVIARFTARADSTLQVATALCSTQGAAHNVVQVRNAQAGLAPVITDADDEACASVRIISPTAVQLRQPSASYSAGKVTLAWATESETEANGFNVLRFDLTESAVQAASGNTTRGDWTKLNSTVIQAQQPGQSSGASYTFTDSTVQPGHTYRYVLEILDADGQTAWRDLATLTTGSQLFLSQIKR